MKKSLLIPALFLGAYMSIANIASAQSKQEGSELENIAQTEQTSEGTQDDDKYVTLTCVVKDEIEPTSERSYRFIAETTNNKTREKNIMMVYNKEVPKNRSNQMMDNYIQKGDTVILKLEKGTIAYKAFTKGGPIIGLENIESINGYKPAIQK